MGLGSTVVTWSDDALLPSSALPHWRSGHEIEEDPELSQYLRAHSQPQQQQLQQSYHSAAAAHPRNSFSQKPRTSAPVSSSSASASASASASSAWYGDGGPKSEPMPVQRGKLPGREPQTKSGELAPQAWQEGGSGRASLDRVSSGSASAGWGGQAGTGAAGVESEAVRRKALLLAQQPQQRQQQLELQGGPAERGGLRQAGGEGEGEGEEQDELMGDFAADPQQKLLQLQRKAGPAGRSNGSLSIALLLSRNSPNAAAALASTAARGGTQPLCRGPSTAGPKTFSALLPFSAPHVSTPSPAPSSTPSAPQKQRSSGVCLSPEEVLPTLTHIIPEPQEVMYPELPAAAPLQQHRTSLQTSPKGPFSALSPTSPSASTALRPSHNSSSWPAAQQGGPSISPRSQYQHPPSPRSTAVAAAASAAVSNTAAALRKQGVRDVEREALLAPGTRTAARLPKSASRQSLPAGGVHHQCESSRCSEADAAGAGYGRTLSHGTASTEGVYGSGGTWSRSSSDCDQSTQKTRQAKSARGAPKASEWRGKGRRSMLVKRNEGQAEHRPARPTYEDDERCEEEEGGYKEERRGREEEEEWRRDVGQECDGQRGKKEGERWKDNKEEGVEEEEEEEEEEDDDVIVALVAALPRRRSSGDLRDAHGRAEKKEQDGAASKGRLSLEEGMGAERSTERPEDRRRSLQIPMGGRSKRGPVSCSSVDAQRKLWGEKEGDREWGRGGAARKAKGRGPEGAGSDRDAGSSSRAESGSEDQARRRRSVQIPRSGSMERRVSDTGNYDVDSARRLKRSAGEQEDARVERRSPIAAEGNQKGEAGAKGAALPSPRTFPPPVSPGGKRNDGMLEKQGSGRRSHEEELLSLDSPSSGSKACQGKRMSLDMPRSASGTARHGAASESATPRRRSTGQRDSESEAESLGARSAAPALGLREGAEGVKESKAASLECGQLQQQKKEKPGSRRKLGKGSSPSDAPTSTRKKSSPTSAPTSLSSAVPPSQPPPSRASSSKQSANSNSKPTTFTSAVKASTKQTKAAKAAYRPTPSPGPSPGCTPGASLGPTEQPNGSVIPAQLVSSQECTDDEEDDDDLYPRQLESGPPSPRPESHGGQMSETPQQKLQKRPGPAVSTLEIPSPGATSAESPSE